jgi:ferredoxin-type protein NapH
MKMSWQLFRHFVQISVLILIVFTSITAWYGAQLARGEIENILNSKPPTFTSWTIQIIDDSYGGSKSRISKTTNDAIQNNDALKNIRSLSGNHWVGEIFGFKIIDPVAGLQALLVKESSKSAVLIALIVPIIIALLFGRIFCSWICPAGFLFECVAKVRSFLLPFNIIGKSLKFWRGHKYTLLIVGLIFSGLFSIPILALIYPPAIIARELHNIINSVFPGNLVMQNIISTTQIFSIFSLFIAFLMLFELFISERAWCKYFCFGGAIYSCLGKFRLINVKLDSPKCNSCGDCTKSCPMDLNPMKNEFGMECDNCLVCMSSCTKSALKFNFKGIK